jgi:hypothetical protein
MRPLAHPYRFIAHNGEINTGVQPPLQGSVWIWPPAPSPVLGSAACIWAMVLR